MKSDSGTELDHLKVDGGMTNGDEVMKILADLGGFTVVRPEMREYVKHPSVACSLLTSLQIDCLGFRHPCWLCYRIVWLGRVQTRDVEGRQHFWQRGL